MPSSTVELACWTRVMSTCYCEAAVPYPLCGLGLLHMMAVGDVGKKLHPSFSIAF